MPRKYRFARTTTIGEWTFNKQLFLGKYTTDPLTDCWTWLGARGPQGGLFGCLKNNHAQMTQARRISYMIDTNQPLEGQEIRMTCANKLCVNPQHMTVKPMRRRGLHYE
jgi:hypothetical protein